MILGIEQATGGQEYEYEEDTAFMIICSALVFFMTPGLAFFYGGLVRREKMWLIP